MRFLTCCVLAASLVACGDAVRDGGALTKAPQSAPSAPAEPMTSAANPRQFVDGRYIDTDQDGVPAQVFRLYRAAFNRVADPTGLGYHIGQVEVYGRPLREIAANFVASPEFQLTFGPTISNSAFVTLLYREVLWRDPDASGLAFWTNQLDTGAKTRGDVMVGFSESGENRARTAAAVAAGLLFEAYPSTRVWLTDGTFVETNPDGVAAQVHRLYQAAFNRVADPLGLGFHVGNVEVYNLTMAQVAANFIASPESKLLYGSSPTNAAFVTALYQNVLHRAPDAAGFAYYVDRLQAGVPRHDLLRNFSESPENRAATLYAIQAGLHFIPYPFPPSTPPVNPLDPLPAFGKQTTIDLLGILPDGVGGEGGDGGGPGDGGASGAAGDGAPIPNATIVLFDAEGRSARGKTDKNGKYLLSFRTSVFKKPYVVKVIDAGGNTLASTTDEGAPTGGYIRINVNPLTDKITSDVLTPGVRGTDKAFSGSAIDLTKFPLAKQNLATSISSALTTAGVTNPAAFDPIKSNFEQNGTGADIVIESISHARDAATGATQLRAKLAPLSTSGGGVVTPQLITATTPLSSDQVAVPSSPLLTFQKLQAWTARWNTCLAGGTVPRGSGDCSLAGLNAVVSPNYKNSSRPFFEEFRTLCSETGGLCIAGSEFRNPNLLFYFSSVNGGPADRAVVEVTIRQPRTGPMASNVTTAPIEYTKTLVYGRDDTTPGLVAGNWVLVGNQRAFSWSVFPSYLTGEYRSPAHVQLSKTTTGIGLSFSTTVFQPDAPGSQTGTSVSANVYAVRLKGPGLPASGLVYAPVPPGFGTGFGILNATGQIPSEGTTAVIGFDFRLAGVAFPSGVPTSATQWPGSPSGGSAVNYAATQFTDFASLGAFNVYQAEIYRSGTVVPVVETARMLAPVEAPSAYVQRPLHDLTPSLAVITPPQPAVTAIQASWIRNPLAVRIESAYVTVFVDGVPRGTNFSLPDAFSPSPTSTSIVIPVPQGGLPSFGYAINDSRSREIGVVGNAARANFAQSILWVN